MVGLLRAVSFSTSRMEEEEEEKEEYGPWHELIEAELMVGSWTKIG